MRLVNAAKHFDRLSVFDGYSGRHLFRAQFDLYDDSMRDAVSVQRRILSTPVDAVMPSRRVITVDGLSRWIAGTVSNTDYFNSSPIRVKHILHLANGIARVRSPGQTVQQQGGLDAYASLAWMKDWKEVEYSNSAYSYYDVYFAKGESVQAGHFIELDGLLLRCRNTYLSEGGFLIAEADDVSGTRQPLTYRARSAYDPVTDVYSVGASEITALVMRFSVDYEYARQAAPKREAGDLVALVRKVDVVSPKAGDVVTLSTVPYQVLSLATEGDCWRLHLRP